MVGYHSIPYIPNQMVAGKAVMDNSTRIHGKLHPMCLGQCFVSARNIGSCMVLKQPIEKDDGPLNFGGDRVARDFYSIKLDWGKERRNRKGSSIGTP